MLRETPIVFAVASGDDLTQRKSMKWIVRTSFTSSQVNFPFAEYVFNKLKYKRIATVGMDYPYGWEVVGGFQKAFEDAGGKVVQKNWVPLGFQDFKEPLQKIRKDVDAVFFGTTSAGAVIISKQYPQFGPKLPILSGGTGCDEFILKHLGDEALGAVSTMNYSAALNTPANKKFAEAYRARYSSEPGFFSESGYTSMLVIDRAIQSIKGPIDKPALLAALKKVELSNSPRGPFKLDAHGNPITNVYIRRIDKVNGKLQNTVIATIKDVSQFWKWNPEEYMKEPPFSRDYPPCKYCDK